MLNFSIYKCSTETSVTNSESGCSILKQNGMKLPKSPHKILTSRVQTDYNCGFYLMPLNSLCEHIYATLVSFRHSLNY